MIERIEQMPAGTVGLRASGRLSKRDYTEVLEPVLLQAVASGELRLLFVLTDFHGLEPAAWPEDVKTGLRTWVRDRSAWKRFALVTDVEWVANAMRLFAWLTPGEVLVRELDGLAYAKRWVAD
ncbi:MAG TPA: STAS/SEC14 domain-containing protein [Conexibacter sp.]|nr:STAS/SEC14 domain-containing protein [Conexibacter sp.]